MELYGKTAIVTGAAGGIGQEIVYRLILEGVNVVLVDINESKLKVVEQELIKEGIKYLVLNVDITNRKQINEMVQSTIDTFGRIDFLINNAGVCELLNFDQITDESWHRILEINLTGVFYTCQAVVPTLIKQCGGKIINVASSAGEDGGMVVGAHYAASKAGVINLTKSLAKFLAPYNVQVNAVSPGTTETEMIEQWPEHYKQTIISRIPLRRLGRAQDIAGVIVFLLHPDSDYITGQVIRINGGLLMI